MVPACGAPHLAFELLSSAPGSPVNCGCVVDDDCGDGAPCTLDDCSAGVCTNAPRRFGDIDGNGTINIFDLFCVLDAFVSRFDDCASVNVDIAPCSADGVINIFDLFAVLDGLSGVDPCGCPPP